MVLACYYIHPAKDELYGFACRFAAAQHAQTRLDDDERARGQTGYFDIAGGQTVALPELAGSCPRIFLRYARKVSYRRHAFALRRVLLGLRSRRSKLGPQRYANGRV